MKNIFYKNPAPFLVIFSAFCIVVIVAVILVRTKAQNRTEKPLDDGLPSVYLTFERKGERELRCRKNKREDVIYLRLHNNSEKPINVAANFAVSLEREIVKELKLPDGTQARGLKNHSEVELCYEVEGMYYGNEYDGVKRKSPPAQDIYCSCSYKFNGKKRTYPSDEGYWILPKDSIVFSVPSVFLSKNLKVYTQFNYLWEFEKGNLKINEPQHRVYFDYYDLPEQIR